MHNTLYPLIVLDVETTGLSPYRNDRVCEIGAYKIKNGRIVGKFHSLVNPQRSLSLGAYMVNGLTSEMLEAAPTFREIALKFLGFIEGCRIAAYNAPFDVSFINSELNHSGEMHTITSEQTLDILLLCRQMLPGAGRYSLSHVAKYLNISTGHSHRALDDARTAWKVLQKLIKRDLLTENMLRELPQKRNLSAGSF